jgi:WD40-like Beta Propeller Repeat
VRPIVRWSAPLRLCVVVARASEAVLPDPAQAVRIVKKFHPGDLSSIWERWPPTRSRALSKDVSSGAPSRNTATQPRRITVSGGRDAAEHKVAWSPNSKHLAFLSDGEERGQLQLYMTDCNLSAPVCLTSLKGFVTTRCGRQPARRSRYCLPKVLLPAPTRSKPLLRVRDRQRER